MLTDIYKSPDRPHIEQAILTEDEVRQRMSDLTRKAVDERARLKDAYINIGRAEAMAQLAITFDEPTALKSDKAREYLKKAKAEKIRLTDAVKEAIIALECETLKLEYDLAKFDCETTDKDFAKLEKQLSFYQSLLRLT